MDATRLTIPFTNRLLFKWRKWRGYDFILAIGAKSASQTLLGNVIFGVDVSAARNWFGIEIGLVGFNIFAQGNPSDPGRWRVGAYRG